MRVYGHVTVLKFRR